MILCSDFDLLCLGMFHLSQLESSCSERSNSSCLKVFHLSIVNKKSRYFIKEFLSTSDDFLVFIKLISIRYQFDRQMPKEKSRCLSIKSLRIPQKKSGYFVKTLFEYLKRNLNIQLRNFQTLGMLFKCLSIRSLNAIDEFHVFIGLIFIDLKRNLGIY